MPCAHRIGEATFMSLVTVIWSMVASACLTLAVIYFLVWWSNRTTWASLFFAMAAVSTAAFTLCELRQMRAVTPEELLSAMRWTHVALLGLLVSTTWFVTFYLGATRRWLAWTVSGLRAFYLLVAFLIWGNVNYLQITNLQPVPFLGDSVTAFEGIRNPWMLFGYATMLLILVFVADATIAAWRRGERRKALMTGGSVELFLLLGTVQAALVHWAKLPIPVLISPLYLGLVLVMATALSRDVLRASRLVHELQASEAGLRESEARMSLAVDAADLGIWIRELARNEIWASHRWRELFGFNPSEPLEFNAMLQRLHPDDREGFQQAHAMAVAGTDGGKYQFDYRLMLPDGSTRWVSSQGRVEFDVTGEPFLIRGAVRDVTERKQAEQEAQLLRQDIAHAGRVSMMGQLASGLAHEINQPLAAILRNAEAAELFLQHSSPDLDEIRAILSDIRSDDERAGQIIDRLRGQLKRQTLDTGRLDVGALVGEVAALVRIDAATRQVKLDIEVPAGLPHVRGDRVQIQQVLLNLLLNGMDALHGTKPEDRRVNVTARLNGAQLIEIAVGDAGQGIPADTLARIFDPFFTTKPDGMGIGLAVSRTIVEAHTGRLWAENRNGGGAVFRFTLPIAEEGATA
jgi:PAS domain S-box-containing protein